MADFDSARAILGSSEDAQPVWADFQNLPPALQRIADHLDRYQNDPDFQASIDAVFETGQVQELGEVSVKVTNLLGDLLLNHTSLFGG